MPYYITSASAPTVVSCGFGHCYEVTQQRLGSFAQSFGLTVVLTFGIALNR
jgi:hypothetical protein